MKKFLVSVLLLPVASISMAQNTKVPAVKANNHLKVYNQCLAVGDINTAITALNYYTVEQGATNNYADTLAMLYLQQNSFAQSYYWAEKRLATKPGDAGLLEIKGVSLDKLQQPKEAIGVFEMLFAKTKSPYHAYKLMELQYGIKRLAECVSTGLAAEKLQYKPDYTMTYNVGEQVGRTYLQASMFNIQALALYELDKKMEAKSYLQRAIALDSNFVLAQQNLAAILATENKAPASKVTAPAGQMASPANKQN
jgi:tetratricopeptide (TPR) repeat protein